MKNKKQINIVNPILPQLEEISKELKEILANGKLTNNSRYVLEFEDKLKKYFGVKYCVSAGNGTLALILAMKAMDLKGEVIVPSFTFSATVHSVIWSNLRPVFADILPDTYNIDIKDIEKKITAKTSAILAVNTYGNPCEVEKLETLAQKYKLKLIFDSAHAFGSLYKGKKIGSFGDAETFSFHATKILPAGEGGAITTNDKKLAEKMSLYRVFGDVKGEDCVLAGFNAKMQEFSAILGLKGLAKIDYYIKNRKLADKKLKKGLSKLEGLGFQKIEESNSVNYQYFPVLIDEKKFGMTRDEVFSYLLKENIIARKYFYPPAHELTCYKKMNLNPSPAPGGAGQSGLEVTEYVSKRILCLPIYSEMASGDIDRIIQAFEKMRRKL